MVCWWKIGHWKSSSTRKRVSIIESGCFSYSETSTATINQKSSFFTSVLPDACKKVPEGMIASFEDQRCSNDCHGHQRFFPSSSSIWLGVWWRRLCRILCDLVQTVHFGNVHTFPKCTAFWPSEVKNVVEHCTGCLLKPHFHMKRHWPDMNMFGSYFLVLHPETCSTTKQLYCSH